MKFATIILSLLILILSIQPCSDGNNGVFSISRNPIFLGIMVANVGLFLVIPNAFTLLIISLSTLSVNTQIRLEEEFLKRELGNEYVEYKEKVRRWI